MSTSQYFYLDDPNTSSVNYALDPNSSAHVIVPAHSYVRYCIVDNTSGAPLVGTADILVKLEGSLYMFGPSDGLTATGLNTAGLRSPPGTVLTEVLNDTKIVFEVSANLTGRIIGKVVYESF